MASESKDNASNGSSAHAVSRRATLDYFNPASASNRLRRMFGTREKVTEGFKTLFWVIPLTVLIWIYAERQQLLQNPASVQGVTVELRKDPGRSVLFTDQGEQTVTLKLMGPLEGVRKAIDRLTQRIPHEILYLDVGSDRPLNDNQPINVADRIQNLDVFKSNGVTVMDVQPRELRVNIDLLGHRKLKVQIPSDRTNLTATRLDPPEVTVNGPEKLLKQLEERGDLRVNLRLDGYSQLKTPGTYTLQSVPVELLVPSRLAVDPNHDHVDATVVVAQSDVHYEIPQPVYVYVDAQPDLLNAYSFELSEGGKSIAHVEVVGPNDQIELIKKNKWIPEAHVKITEEDVVKKQPIVPTFYLPPGVTVSNDAPRQPIKFTSTAR